MSTRATIIDMDDDARLEEYGTNYFAFFMSARIQTTYQMLIACAAIYRMPRRAGPARSAVCGKRGKAFKVYVDCIDEGIDLMKDTMEEIHA